MLSSVTESTVIGDLREELRRRPLVEMLTSIVFPEPEMDIVENVALDGPVNPVRSVWGESGHCLSTTVMFVARALSELELAVGQVVAEFNIGAGDEIPDLSRKWSKKRIAAMDGKAKGSTRAEQSLQVRLALPAIQVSAPCALCDRRLENGVYLPSYGSIACRACVMMDPSNVDEALRDGYQMPDGSLGSPIARAA